MEDRGWMMMCGGILDCTMYVKVNREYYGLRCMTMSSSIIFIFKLITFQCDPLLFELLWIYI